MRQPPVLVDAVLEEDYGQKANVVRQGFVEKDSLPLVSTDYFQKPDKNT